jgi:hypothetical protein
VRAALDKYQDPIQAIHDGYFSTLGCVSCTNRTATSCAWWAAEWFVPLATGVKERPKLNGRPFDGPMEGHPPLLSVALHHYDLHVWLWKEHPAGLFSPTNPDVKCPAGAYSFDERAPKIVEHP